MQQKLIAWTGLVRGDFLLFIVKFICGNFTSSRVKMGSSSTLLFQAMRSLTKSGGWFESLVAPNYRVDNFSSPCSNWCTPLLSLVPGPQEHLRNKQDCNAGASCRQDKGWTSFAVLCKTPSTLNPHPHHLTPQPPPTATSLNICPLWCLHGEVNAKKDQWSASKQV